MADFTRAGRVEAGSRRRGGDANIAVLEALVESGRTGHEVVVGG